MHIAVYINVWTILLFIEFLLFLVCCSCQVEHVKDYIPKACPHGDSMILDCEVRDCHVLTMSAITCHVCSKSVSWMSSGLALVSITSLTRGSASPCNV